MNIAILIMIGQLNNELIISNKMKYHVAFTISGNWFRLLYIAPLRIYRNYVFSNVIEENNDKHYKLADPVR